MDMTESETRIQQFGRGFFQSWATLAQLLIAVTGALIALLLLVGWTMWLPMYLTNMVVPLPAQNQAVSFVAALAAVVMWNIFITYPIANGISKVIDDE